MSCHRYRSLRRSDWTCRPAVHRALRRGAVSSARFAKAREVSCRAIAGTVQSPVPPTATRGWRRRDGRGADRAAIWRRIGVTHMTDKQLPSGERQHRALTPAMVQGARLRAVGFSQQATASQLRQGLRTVQHWEERDDYIALIDGFKVELRHRLGDKLISVFYQAADIVQLWLSGDIPAADKRYVEAKGYVNQAIAYLRPDTSPQAGPAGVGSGASVAFQVNVNPAGDRPRLTTAEADDGA